MKLLVRLYSREHVTNFRSPHSIVTKLTNNPYHKPREMAFVLRCFAVMATDVGLHYIISSNEVDSSRFLPTAALFNLSEWLTWSRARQWKMVDLYSLSLRHFMF